MLLCLQHYLKAIENNPILSDANHRVAIFYHLKVSSYCITILYYISLVVMSVMNWVFHGFEICLDIPVLSA